MSLAWSSLVLLIVLLPGVLFFVGIYLPEQFTRESEPRSPLGQLAGALLIAFVVHGLGYAILSSVCFGRFPCISIQELLNVINVAPEHSEAAPHVDKMLFAFRWWILAYVLSTAFVGAGIGGAYGLLIVKRKTRGLSRHSWIYALNVEGLTYAYVLTKVREEDRILLYKGFLQAFGLRQDGRFSYIVLINVTRLYLKLDEAGSVTSGEDIQRAIGQSSPSAISVPAEPRKRRTRLHSLFVIEGEDIANAVFDILETSAEAVGAKELDAIVKEEEKAVELETNAFGDARILVM